MRRSHENFGHEIKGLYSERAMRLIALLFVLATLASGPGRVFAADERAAAPALPSAQEGVGTLPVAERALPVVELFSTWACLFCPQAEAILGALVQEGRVLGATCVVDYFDPSPSSPAIRQCTQRQERYARALHSGPIYTPQMIVNGSADVIGYRREEIAARLSDPSQGLVAIDVRQEKTPEGGRILVLGLPGLFAGSGVQGRALDVEVLSFRPRVEESSGGRTRVFVNRVMSIQPAGAWDGTPQTRRVAVSEPSSADSQLGHIVLAFDSETAVLMAAGSAAQAGGP